MRVHVYLCVHMCVLAWRGHRLTSAVALCSSPIFFTEHGALINSAGLNKPPESFPSPVPQSWDYNWVLPAIPHFAWVLGI